MPKRSQKGDIGNLESRWVTDIDEFALLNEEWNELLSDSHSDTIFLTWEWLFNWWKHLSGDRELAIIVIRQRGRLMAIVPLCQRPRSYATLLPYRALEFLGAGNVGSDYLSVIVRRCADQYVQTELLGLLSTCNLVLSLSNVDRDDVSVKNMAVGLLGKHWRVRRTTTSFSPFIALSGHDWDSYCHSIGSSQKNRFRKKVKKLNSSFAVRLECIQTQEKLPAALAEMMKLHNQRWAARGGSNALHSQELIDFHRSFSSSALRKGWLRLYILYLNDVPAATVYGFLHKAVFSYYQAGFDPTFSQHSLGLLMLGLTIQDAIDCKADIFDFLHGEEAYKYVWANDERELVRLDMFPPHMRGQACELILKMRNDLKSLVGPRVPAAVKSWVNAPN